MDAEVETKLSKAAVEAALTTVDVTLGSLITDVECYEFGMRFTLTLASEVLEADYGEFKAVLEKVWTAQITGENMSLKKKSKIGYCISRP